MNFFVILAQTTQAAQDTAAASNEIVPIHQYWTQITSLGLLEALTFISFGTVCLLYGWRLFKTLVVISFAVLGMYAGIIAADKISGEGNQVLGGFVGLVAFAALAIPMMKWCVSILGALAGGIVTAGLWYAFELPEKYIWAGGLIGVVAGGMIAFIALKWAVILFSCLGGSALLSTGLIAMFYLWNNTSEEIHDLVFHHNWFLPVAIIVPTAIGFMVQHKFIKKSPQWSL
ncbi:MAG: hypothetical protein WC962_05490 [Phycisphaerae bacterium]|jgi:hypothetical protein